MFEIHEYVQYPDSALLYFIFNIDQQGSNFLDMIQGATIYLRGIIPNDSYVGIVEFESSAYVLSSLVYIDNDDSRELLVTRLPSVTGGGTCIGCGILTGIDVSNLKIGSWWYVTNRSSSSSVCGEVGPVTLQSVMTCSWVWVWLHGQRSQGRIKDFQIETMRTQRIPGYEARSPLYSQRLGPLWSSRVLDALSCYLSLILKHSDTKLD